jgi:hypothetical protein
LQCSEAEDALFKGVAESPRERCAHFAIAVEEDPASRGVTAFRVRYF